MSDTNIKIEMGASLSFNAGIAKICGVNASIVYNHILYWLRQNIRNPRCWIDDKIWMYESLPAISEFFGFLSEKQVRSAIDSLIEHKLIEKSNFHPNKFNRICWYTVTDISLVLSVKEINTVRPTGQMHVAEKADGKDLEGRCIYKEEIRIRNKKNNNIPPTPKGDAANAAGAGHLLPFGQYVKLSQQDYDKLCLHHTKSIVDELIEEMNDYIPNMSKRPYKDHAAALRTWIKKREKEPNKVEPHANSINNRELANQIIIKYQAPDRSKYTIDLLPECVRAETYIGTRLYEKKLKYTELGFKEQFENILRSHGYVLRKVK